MKQYLILGLILLLLTSEAFAVDSNNVTSFSSFQVSNTSDQNITLSCLTSGAGCKFINYSIDNGAWTKVSLPGTFNSIDGNKDSWEDGDYSSNLTWTTTGSAVWAVDSNFSVDGNKSLSVRTPAVSSWATAPSSSKRFTYFWVRDTNWISQSGFGIAKGVPITNSTIQVLIWPKYNCTVAGCANNWKWQSGATTTTDLTQYYPPLNDRWYLIKIDYNDGGATFNAFVYDQNGALVAGSSGLNQTNVGTKTHALIYGSSVVAPNARIYTDGYLQTNTDYNATTFPIGFDLNGSYNFLYSGAGDHNIQYFSTDNSDNTETTKSSLFTTYGTGHFIFKDQNSGLDLNGVTVTSTMGDNNTLTLNRFDTNFVLLGATNTQVTYTFTKSGYATRYYSSDLNQFSDFNVTFAMLPNTIDLDVPFKVYQTDETTLFTDTYVEVIDSDTNWTVGKLKTNSNGEVTFNLRADDSNYKVNVNNGAFIYTPVALTIYYPKNEQTGIQITEKWRVDITQNLYVSYTDLNTTKIVYLLPDTGLPYTIKIKDMNNNYFSRTYAKTYPGNPLTDVFQPYLVPVSSGLATTINVQNTNTRVPIPGVVIKIYGVLPVVGKTLFGQNITDSKGQIIELFIAGDQYIFEVYLDEELLSTYNYTANVSQTWIYYSFLTLDNNSLPSIPVVTSNDFNTVTLDFYSIRNTLFNTCSNQNPCFPSSLIAIILTIIILLTSTTLVQGSYIGVKGLSIIAFCCFTVFFGIGWLPIFIYAFLGTITLLLAVIVQ